MRIQTGPDEPAECAPCDQFDRLEHVRVQECDTVTLVEAEIGRSVRQAAATVVQLGIGLLASVRPHSDVARELRRGFREKGTEVRTRNPLRSCDSGHLPFRA